MGSCHALAGARAERALAMLHRVTRTLESAGVTYWLDHGTLLGVIREQRLLPWDTDLDISVPASSLPQLKAAVPALKALGLRLRLRQQPSDAPPWKSGAPRLLKVRNRRLKIFRGDLLLDVFITYRHQDRYYWSIWKHADRSLHLRSVPAHFFDVLESVEFDGRAWPVPSSTASYLAARYGNWRQPVQNWDCYCDEIAVAGATSAVAFQHVAVDGN